MPPIFESWQKKTFDLFVLYIHNMNSDFSWVEKFSDCQVLIPLSP